MNRNMIDELKEKTNYSNEKCSIINSVISNHSIIGRKNKDKIIADFIEKLNIEKNDANNLYNVCMEFIVKNKFTK